MYQPAISDENVRRLYQMKLKEKRPMTKIINQIIEDFFIAYAQGNSITKHVNRCGVSRCGVTDVGSDLFIDFSQFADECE